MEDTMESVHGALDKLVACELCARFAWLRLHFGNMHIEGVGPPSACYWICVHCRSCVCFKGYR